MSTLEEVRAAAVEVLVAARRWATADRGGLRTVLDPPLSALLADLEEMERAVREYTVASGQEPEYVWVPLTWADVAPGDRVRLPGRPDTEEGVLAVLPLDWHVDPKSKERWPRPLEHSEIKVTFCEPERTYGFPPSGQVEIRREAEVSPERFAAIISLLSRELGAAALNDRLHVR